jgi:hypothetical protein
VSAPTLPARSPSRPRRARDAAPTILLAPDVALAHEVLAFVVAHRQLLRGLHAADGGALEGAATRTVLLLAARDPGGARDAARATAAALDAAVACGALPAAPAAGPRARLARLRRILALRARAA